MLRKEAITLQNASSLDGEDNYAEQIKTTSDSLVPVWIEINAQAIRYSSTCLSKDPFFYFLLSFVRSTKRCL